MGDRAELLAYQRDVLGLTQAQIDQLSVDLIIATNGSFLKARQQVPRKTLGDVRTQVLPPLVMAQAHTMETTAPNLLYMPTELRVWDLQRLVDDGLGVQEVPYYITEAFAPVGTKAGVRDCIVQNVYGLVKRLPVRVTLGSTLAGEGFQDLEFCFINTQNRCLPVEVKEDWVLEDLEHVATEQFFNLNRNRNNSALCRAFCQLNQYLVMNDVCYGLLFTYNRAWFVHVVAYHVLEVAPIVLSESGTLLAYMESFLRVASANLAEPYPSSEPVTTAIQARYKRLQARNASKDARERAKKLSHHGDGRRGRDVDGEGEGDGDSLPGTAIAMQGQSRRTSVSVSSTDVVGGSGDDCESPHKDQMVSWFSVNKKFRVGCGRTGAVFAGTLRSRGVAVKIAGNSTSSISLDREREFYRELEHLQGECIPHILSYDCGSDEGFNGFLMELLRPMPHSFDAWSPEDIQSSKQSLAMLVEKGNYLQNDLRPVNFGKQEVTGRVLVLDLEDLVRSATSDLSS